MARPATVGEPNMMAMEFHVSRKARDRYQFDESLFAISGHVIFANFHAARVFAQKINQKRDLIRFPEQTVHAGQINTMGLIDEILHFVFDLYRRQNNPDLMHQALEWLEAKLGRQAVDGALRRFVEEFPPLAVYRQQVDAEAYLAGTTAGVSNRQVALEEMLMLRLANLNPAVSSFIELFDDSTLQHETAYLQVMFNLHEFFDAQPKWGPANENLIDMLRSPAIAVPYSLSGQLEYIRDKWGYLLGSYLLRLLSSLDLIKEEEKAAFAGPGPALTIELAGLETEPERYSTDQDWMPRVVMIAKSTYVWLDQLSKKYGRTITRLDQIPDEELDTLARWGFTGLWLIGLWERSRASQTIKKLTGNPEAVASAYSLLDYEIAADLGGEDAYQKLRQQAWRHGIRLASDMVPNHMGMDSKWVIDHPDWFISLDYSPFPSYSFTGQNLSWDQRVGIYLEDHYYSRTDAAVVFKRVDRWTGAEKYIYHGNDGTSMPWNDTAQLNFLNPEVREAVIQTILHVARKFPIIRFDAAMTLTKRHYQRLWFPEPGTGGAIPSRAEHGMTKAEFDAAMPNEFWREVVDRVAQEAPDTLLLAEAFWLMEGYFVRTLGMHRVYNSAFMNMLKAEDNAKFRTSIKNVLEFDPEILKRFVNFMNNPDEETAVAQFGKDDKYFGVCTMMVTMPGLPMFGHGQIEGYSEKYGMEYRRAYWDEQPDWELIRRHEREIFPLMKRRHIFADAQNFLLYDFFTPEGYVNENVFAYSNRCGEERGLVVYNNKFDNAHGWIHTSVAYSVKTGQGDERTLVQKNLGDGLGLHNDENYFCIFRDHVAGLEYIRNSKELFDRGLYVELGAFKYQVFLDFREVHDDAAHHYAALAASLGGRGVPSIDHALHEMCLQPITEPFKALVSADTLRRLLDARVRDAGTQPDESLLGDIQQTMARLLGEARRLGGGAGDEAELARQARRELEVILRLPVLMNSLPIFAASPRVREQHRSAVGYLQARLDDDPTIWGTLFAWWSVHSLAAIVSPHDFAQQSRSWIDEWRLGNIIAAALQDLGIAEVQAAQAVTLVKALTGHQQWAEFIGAGARSAGMTLQTLLEDGDIRQFLQVNRFNDVLWFNKEAFDELRWWLFVIATVAILSKETTAETSVAQITTCYDIIEQWRAAQEKSGYQVEKLIAAAQSNG
jgi:glycosidase